MEIGFFEEFPSEENLGKLNLVKRKIKLYLAARSLAEFYDIRKDIKEKSKVKEFIYWPILDKKEGYWISPFSRRQALLRIFRELEGEKVAVMVDLELPTTQNGWLYFTQLFHFLRNKKLIKDFMNDYRGDIYLAEYYPEGSWKESVLQWLGLHYGSNKVKVMKMMYHSLHPFKESFVKKQLKRGIKEYGGNYLVAYGTLAKGINGKEKLLSVQQLQKDLALAREAGIKEVVIFRLGGLNEKYVRIVETFS